MTQWIAWLGTSFVEAWKWGHRTRLRAWVFHALLGAGVALLAVWIGNASPRAARVATGLVFSYREVDMKLRGESPDPAWKSAVDVLTALGGAYLATWPGAMT